MNDNDRVVRARRALESASPELRWLVGEIADSVRTTAMSCYEAIQGYWDPSGDLEGFGAMQDCLEEELMMLDQPLPDYAERDARDAAEMGDCDDEDDDKPLGLYRDERYDGGEMHELFGRERKIGDPEAGDTVIDHIKDASPDAKPDLRLRFVEDDDGEYVKVEFVREPPPAEPLTAEELSNLLYGQLANDAPDCIQRGTQKTPTEFVVYPFDGPPLSVKVAPVPG